VQVDQEGKLTVVGPGEATVSASFGDAAASVHISVGEEEDLSGGGAGDAGEGAGTGSGSGAGMGEPGPQNVPREIPTDEPAAGEIGLPPDREAEEVPIPPGRDIRILSADVAALLWQNAPDAQTSTGGMAGDAVQLTVPEEETSLPAGALAAFVCVCLGAGGLTGILKYIMESRGIRIWRKARSR
jgi:hypothetical protein